MTDISQMLIELGLNAEAISDVLDISLEQALGFLAGTKRPSTREIHVLKGWALAANRTAEVITSPPVAITPTTNRSSGLALEDRHTSNNTAPLRGSYGALRKESVRTEMKPSKKKNSTTLTSLELCSGGGGAALGLEQANFHPVVLLDNDRHACVTCH